MVHSGEQPLYSGIVSTEGTNPQEAAIFISPAVLPYLNECVEIGMDGTFGSKPKNPVGVHQVIVLTIFFEGHVSVYKKIYCF